MTNNVINFMDKLTARKFEYEVDVSCTICACQRHVDEENETPIGYAPLVIHESKGALIISLICLGCGNEVLIQNGRILAVEHAND